MGKTEHKNPFEGSGKKHPHMRGEDFLCQEDAESYLETPPHAWGRQRPLFEIQHDNGNTPTCVGKTYQAHTIATLFWKHPHMRGEDFNAF